MSSRGVDRPLGRLVQELESRGLLRTVLGGDGALGGRAVKGLAIDPRSVRDGDIFVAVTEAGGHDLVAAAVEHGAAAVMAERAAPRIGVPQILVGSTRSALAVAAAWLHDFPSYELGVVAVTGSDGTTATSHLVTAMMVAAGVATGKVAAFDGVPAPGALDLPELHHDLRRMAAAGDRFAVVELPSAMLQRELVAEIACDVAVLTNVQGGHVESHAGTAAAVAVTRSVFEQLAPGPHNPDKGLRKTAVINAEDPLAKDLIAASRDVGATALTYAVGPAAAADITASAVNDSRAGLRMSVRTARWEGEVRLQLGGHFNAYSALAAIGVGEALGLDAARMRDGLASVAVIPGQLIRVDEGQEFNVYADSADTPGALAKTLDALAPQAASRAAGLISVIGSPADDDPMMRAMIGRVAGERSRVVVIADDRRHDQNQVGAAEEMALGASDAGRVRDFDLFVNADRRAAMHTAFEMARPGDVVVLAPATETESARLTLREMGYAAIGLELDR